MNIATTEELAPSGAPDDRSWSAPEVAYYLNVSESLVRKLEQRGDLPALPRIGRRLNFDPQVVRQFQQNPAKWKKPRRG